MPMFHRSNGPDLCFEQAGARCDPSLVLIHGIGCQLNQWPQSLIDALCAGGLRVIRVDNRDAGRSGSMDALEMPDLSKLGQTSFVPPYALADMADDVIALLDHLGQAGAHIVGVSLGGMVAQHLAASHGNRVFSMTSIMSSSGDPELPAGTDEAMAMLTAPPASDERDDVIAQSQAAWDLIGGPHYRSTEVGIGRFAAETYDRARNPAGFLRQFAAASSDAGRAAMLANIEVPTLVIHGTDDPLVPLAAGEDTARRIAGAGLTLVEKMGHDLPEPLVPELATAILKHTATATTRR